MRRFVPPSLDVLNAPADTQHLLRIEEQARGRGRTEGLAEGREAGFAEGSAAARATLQPRIEALEADLARRIAESSLADTLRATIAGRGADRVALDEAMRDAVHAALALLCPALMAAHAGSEIAALVASALQDRPDDQLVLHAEPDTLDQVRAVLDARDADRVRLRPEPGRAPGQAEIAWKTGGLSYDPAALLADVQRLLRPAAPSVSPISATEDLP